MVIKQGDKCLVCGIELTGTNCTFVQGQCDPCIIEEQYHRIAESTTVIQTPEVIYDTLLMNKDFVVNLKE